MTDNVAMTDIVETICVIALSIDQHIGVARDALKPIEPPLAGNIGDTRDESHLLAGEVMSADFFSKATLRRCVAGAHGTRTVIVGGRHVEVVYVVLMEPSDGFSQGGQAFRCWRQIDNEFGFFQRRASQFIGSMAALNKPRQSGGSNSDK